MPFSPKPQVNVEPFEGIVDAAFDISYETETPTASGVKKRALRVKLHMKAAAIAGAALVGVLVGLLAGR